MSFCPTGGVTPGNAPDYLALPNVLCVGGSWVCDPKFLKAGEWSTIEGLARDASQLGR
jgi:2-dehydro-3-deoxyphosphogluconate aldolase/(4S)-4-hydroxy-2-oxoglutarate aldolase